MKNQNVVELETSGQVVRRSRAEYFDLVIEGLKALDEETFTLLPRVENMPEEDLRAMPVAGTPFQPIAAILLASGVTKAETIGEVMDVLGLTRGAVHCFTCECAVEESPTITGYVLVAMFMALEQGQI